MNSPKGKYRLKEFLIVGLIFLAMVAFSGGYDGYGQWHIERALSPSGWIFKQLNNIAEICIGLIMLYMGHRIINHYRTHDFIDCEHDPHKLKILAVTLCWILAIAYVVGNGIR